MPRQGPRGRRSPPRAREQDARWRTAHRQLDRSRRARHPGRRRGPPDGSTAPGWRAIRDPRSTPAGQQRGRASGASSRSRQRPWERSPESRHVHGRARPPVRARTIWLAYSSSGSWHSLLRRHPTKGRGRALDRLLGRGPRDSADLRSSPIEQHRTLDQLGLVEREVVQQLSDLIDPVGSDDDGSAVGGDGEQSLPDRGHQLDWPGGVGHGRRVVEGPRIRSQAAHGRRCLRPRRFRSSRWRRGCCASPGTAATRCPST